MSTFVKIKALKPSLSSSEAKLADFTLNSGAKIRSLSSVELARQAGVSQSSVVKFAQKLGYKGFPAFKLAVIDDLNLLTVQPETTLTQITHTDPIHSIALKLLSHQQGILHETHKLNDAEQFEQAIVALKSARKILLCAVGGSFTMAQDFALKLQKIGLPAIAQTDELSAASYIATMGKDDLLIAISDSGQSKAVLRVARQAKNNHCSILSLSRYGSNPLNELACIKLFNVIGEEPVKHASILTRTSQSYLIDVLFTGLTQSNLRWQKRADKANEHVYDIRHS
ncbi:HTH-type transcriptional regulator MurR [Pseudoalteromonas holothuriae]|uniref:HTH-type transcriptional regulator MurR n=1 Tax=Pseudoalteromonas holothuriae TaxID=2963714 RepID=A0A9W4QYI1_9GAMM|nr:MULTISPECIES: MurR/RpiR family transcriptional regulator [unclassified Pseudoalteromonas]CAH9054075.1 HTH-type transcriptional regulator MurR [Pseudoalteromonas sp. CIP111951]CAH9059100.1 HTH-type transcriptional regulator MurR [Pseudoalteromonas sp. CIP111854]